MSQPSAITNDISVAHFKHWLLQQNPTTTFRYFSSCDCLLARYLKDHGLSPHVGGDGGFIMRDGEKVWFNIPAEMVGALHGGSHHVYDHEFITYAEVWAQLEKVQ